MAFGYEGYALVDGILMLCTGASCPRTRTRLDSSSGYGGQISIPVAQMGIGSPRIRDWSSFDGTISYDLTFDFFDDILKDWLFNRQTFRSIELYPVADSQQVFSKCYWSSISLSASSDSNVSGNLSFTALDRDSITIIDDYFGNPTGVLNDSEMLTQACDEIPPLLRNVQPVPFWATTLTLNSVLEDRLLSWDLTFNQDPRKFFGCTKNANPIAPLYIAVGPLTGTLTLEVLPFQETYTLAAAIATALLNINGHTLTMTDLELETDEDAVRDQNSFTAVSLTYSIYGLSNV